MGLYAVAASQLVSWLLNTIDRISINFEKRNFKKRERGTTILTRSLAHASGYQKPMHDVKAQFQTASAGGL